LLFAGERLVRSLKHAAIATLKPSVIRLSAATGYDELLIVDVANLVARVNW